MTRLVFPNGGHFFTGNRCERIYSNQGERFVRGTSLTDRKLELLFNRRTEPDGPARLTIGVPRVMNIYENFPFWNTLLVECGFKVQLSDVVIPRAVREGGWHGDVGEHLFSRQNSFTATSRT